MKNDEAKLELYIITLLKISTILNGYKCLRIFAFTTFPYATWLWLLLYYSLGKIPPGKRNSKIQALEWNYREQFMGLPWVFPRTLTNSPEELVESFLPKWNEWPMFTNSREIKLL